MQKDFKIREDWEGKMIYLELWKKKLIWPCEKIVYAQPKLCPRKREAQNSLEFELQTGHLV